MSTSLPRAQWMLLLAMVVTLSPRPCHAQNPQPVTIRVFADQPAGPVWPIWQWFGYDEANYTFTPDGRPTPTPRAADPPPGP